MDRQECLSYLSRRVPPMPSARPTIVLIVSCGWGVKSLLQTDALPCLEEAADLVILAPPELAHGVQEVTGGRIPVETLKPYLQTPTYGRLRERRYYYHLRLSPTGTRQCLYEERRRSFRGHPRRQLRDVLFRFEARWRGNTRRYLSLLAREMDALVTGSPDRDYYGALYDRYRPALVVSTVPHMPEEALPVIIARRRGVHAACRINSWDNLTSKPTYPAEYDSYLVWSRQMEQELRTYYPEARTHQIISTGVPQFDWYRSPEFVQSREEFCRQQQLDPSRPLLFYGLATPHLAPTEDLLVKRLAADLANLGITPTPQLLVRTHPADNGGRFNGWQPPAGVRLRRPGAETAGRIEAFCPTRADDRELVNSILHASVVINLASTLTLEAAVCDRPVVNVAFDLAPDGRYNDRIRFYYTGYDHYRTVLATGAASVAYTYEELVAALGTGVRRPEAQRAERQALVNLWCGANDGQAGRRLAATLLALARENAGMSGKSA